MGLPFQAKANPEADKGGEGGGETVERSGEDRGGKFRGKIEGGGRVGVDVQAGENNEQQISKNFG